jgi:maltooligosyltrehalose trehalohydrolase
MQPVERGYHEAEVMDVEPGSLYFYRLAGEKERPDPASRSQPQGVHGPSEVADPRFAWEDSGWTGLSLEEYTIYELHVGTFTPEGTFDAVIPHLTDLSGLGVMAIELMPPPSSRERATGGMMASTHSRCRIPMVARRG